MLDNDKLIAWETEDPADPSEYENPYESEFISEVSEDIDTRWVTENGSVGDMTLDYVVRNFSFSEKDISRTGIRVYPSGLRLAWRMIGRKKGVSSTTMQMHTSKHGMAIAIRDSRIQAVSKAYAAKEKLAETGTGDPIQNKELIRKLEERVKIDFVNPLNFNSSVAMYKDMTGVLSKLSDVLGMPNVTIYCFLCMLSVETIDIGVSVGGNISEELTHFWNKIEERGKSLG